jgi:hypothetical protein
MAICTTYAGNSLLLFPVSRFMMRVLTMKQRSGPLCCSCMAGVVSLAYSGQCGVPGVMKEGGGYCWCFGFADFAHCSAILSP